MKRIGLLLIPLVGLLLAGCANSLYEGRYAWGDGWRLGRITATGVGAGFQNKLAKNCTAPLSVDQRFVTVRLGESGRGFWRTVPIPTKSSWSVGDWLYINVLDCSAPLTPRFK